MGALSVRLGWCLRVPTNNLVRRTRLAALTGPLPRGRPQMSLDALGRRGVGTIFACVASPLVRHRGGRARAQGCACEARPTRVSLPTQPSLIGPSDSAPCLGGIGGHGGHVDEASVLERSSPTLAESPRPCNSMRVCGEVISCWSRLASAHGGAGIESGSLFVYVYDTGLFGERPTDQHEAPIHSLLLGGGFVTPGSHRRVRRGHSHLLERGHATGAAVCDARRQAA